MDYVCKNGVYCYFLNWQPQYNNPFKFLNHFEVSIQTCTKELLLHYHVCNWHGTISYL